MSLNLMLFFTVEGWPINKSRITTDYIDYEGQTAKLLPIHPREHWSNNTYWLKPRSKIQVLIAVQSAPMNIDHRNEIRKTWGNLCKSDQHNWCSIIFVLGEFSDNKMGGRIPEKPNKIRTGLSAKNLSQLQSNLEKEHRKFGDILQEPFKDTYNNLTLKSIFILKYFVSASIRNSESYFLLKTDDDSFIHLEHLYNLVKKKMGKKSDSIIGYLQVRK